MNRLVAGTCGLPHLPLWASVCTPTSWLWRARVTSSLTWPRSQGLGSLLKVQDQHEVALGKSLHQALGGLHPGLCPHRPSAPRLLENRFLGEQVKLIETTGDTCLSLPLTPPGLLLTTLEPSPMHGTRWKQ